MQQSHQWCCQVYRSNVQWPVKLVKRLVLLRFVSSSPSVNKQRRQAILIQEILIKYFYYFSRNSILNRKQPALARGLWINFSFEQNLALLFSHLFSLHRTLCLLLNLITMRLHFCLNFNTSDIATQLLWPYLSQSLSLMQFVFHYPGIFLCSRLDFPSVITSVYITFLVHPLVFRVKLLLIHSFYTFLQIINQ